MSEKQSSQPNHAHPERSRSTLPTEAQGVVEPTTSLAELMPGSQRQRSHAPGPANVQAARLRQLQQLHGNAYVQRTIGANHVQRDDPAVAAPSAEDIAIDFEADAQEFFANNMDMELRNGAAIEAAAIGRRAGVHAGQLVRDTCEPFERDQEIDTLILNTIFSLAGGGASVAEANTSGTGDTRGANVGSRVVRMGLGLVQTWLPTLAGYRTVGQLKDAAVRQIGEAAQQEGETSSGSFADYEDAVMEALQEDWDSEVERLKARISAGGADAALMASVARGYLPARRTEYQRRLRTEYGSQSSHAAAMISQISSLLQPRLSQLRTHLEEAKASRERWQAGGAILGGIAGGAAIGAGIGAFAGGVGAVPGAVIGGIVGGVVGIAGAISILWD